MADINRRSFIKRIGLIAGLGLIQPVELIKLFKPKSTTFYSLPPKILTTSELNDLLQKTYGKMIVELFSRNCSTYETFRFAEFHKEIKGKGYQYAIKQAQIY